MVGKRRKRALHKDFWMEVRKSRARYIDLLYRGPGCGFFLGDPGILSGHAAFR